MSHKFQAQIFRAGPEDRAQRFVLLALAELANDHEGGRAWPSVATLAAMTCMTKRNAQLALKALAEGHWIEVAPGAGRNGTNVYRINAQKLASAAESPAPSEKNSGGGETISP